MFNIPKSELIKTILDNFTSDEIRKHFNIQVSTNPLSRLDSFKKTELVELIMLKDEAVQKYRLLNEEYPLTGTPALYILTYDDSMYVDAVVSRYSSLRSEIDVRGDGKLICVIVWNKLEKLNNRISELQVQYKKKVEYIESNESLTDYGELKYVESLEKAYLWFFKGDFNYAVLATSDYYSVRGIIYAIAEVAKIQLTAPSLSEEMMKRLQVNSQLSNASFTKSNNISDDFIDVKSITVYDSDLSSTSTFKNLDESKSRELYSSFMKKNDFVLAGIGLSRRTSKLWTPSKLKKSEVLKIADRIVQKLETETKCLDLHTKKDSSSYFRLFQQTQFLGKSLSVNEVTYYSKLLAELHTNYVNQHYDHPVDTNVVKDTVKNAKRFGFNIALSYECDNCGSHLHTCKVCGSTNICIDADFAEFKCVSCNATTMFSQLTCSCDSQIEIIDPINNLFIYPENRTIDEIIRVLNLVTKTVFNIVGFAFNFGVMKIIKTKFRIGWSEWGLKDLKKWRDIGRFHLISVSETDKKRYRRYLKVLREKCDINSFHPTQSDCSKCKKKVFHATDLNSSSNMCLLRLFGLAFDEFFDGIHTGIEQADVKYHDIIVSNSKPVYLGIHFKSKANSITKPIGRGHKNVQSAVTQLVYTLVMVSQNKFKFDILGVSIPQKISQEAMDIFRETSKRYSVDYICLDEEDWFKILSKVEDDLKMITP